MNPTIQTERLSLRPPTLRDAPLIADYLRENEIVRMLGRAPWPYTLKDAHNWIEQAATSLEAGTEYAFVIVHADHGVIGSTGLVHVDNPVTRRLENDTLWELGYWIGKPYWGCGYVTEAARGLLDWAQEALGADGFVSGHIDDNDASGHVLKKLGFKEVGTITHYARGRDCDVHARRYVRGAPAETALHFGS